MNAKPFFFPNAGILLLASVLALTPGCRSTSLTKIKNGNGDEQIYLTLRKPDAVLNTFARTWDAEVTSKLLTHGLTNDAALTLASKIVSLASNYDNLTVQTMMLAKSAVIGLNSNPSSPTNQAEFWKLLGSVANSSLHIRDHEYHPIYASTNQLGEISLGDLPPKISGKVSFWTPSRSTEESAKVLGGIVEDWEKPISRDKLIPIGDQKIEETIKNFGEHLKKTFPREVTGYRLEQVVGNGKSGTKVGYWWTVSADSLDLRRFVGEYMTFWRSTRGMYLEVMKLPQGHFNPAGPE